MARNGNDRHPWNILVLFFVLGCTSFGGPVAHLGYFREAFVVRQQWLSEQAYADLVALCQFLPGPASSQVGMVLGFYRAGYPGALAAWLGFTLPSAVIMILFALGLQQFQAVVTSGVLHCLKLVAVAVVVHAVWGMGRTFCTDSLKFTFMVLSVGMMLWLPYSWTPILVMVCAALAGIMLLPTPKTQTMHDLPSSALTRRSGYIGLLLFVGLLLVLPLLAAILPWHGLAMLDAFYRTGSTVLGGGHVVLPVLQSEVVSRGWISNDIFLAGYGLAQALPGPLFTFAAFLGASMSTQPSGWAGGFLALIAIFLPAFLLVMAALPFWAMLGQYHKARQGLAGINAAVVGLLLASLYPSVWTGSMPLFQDVCLVLLAWLMLAVWKMPSWSIVLTGALAGRLFWGSV
ncbi:MAG: hypothetical protein RIQ52_1525 [Pseudomonadota bacterium]